jgi:glucokinase
MSRELYLGVDMGGTHIKIAIVGSQGNIVEEAVIDTDAKEKPLNVIKTIIDKSVKLNNYRMIKSVGIGMAGDVDYNSGIVRFSPNLSKWKKVPLKKIFEQISHKKTYVDNDANTAAIGAF